MIRAQDPAFVFIVKTWLDIAMHSEIRDTLQMRGWFGVSRLNHGGSLAMFWRQDTNIRVIDSSPYFIDAIINEGLDDTWRFSGFYGRLETHLRQESWNCLRRLH